MLTSYLEKLRPEYFHRTVYHLAQTIRERASGCNMVYGRGTSSALVLAAVAAHLNVGWAFIRKEGVNNSHAEYAIEVAPLDVNCKKLTAVFVDDLIDTGTSYLECKTALENFCLGKKIKLKCLGAALYEDEDEFREDSSIGNAEE
jgi:phosphoribosylpyrophosphate synthetase